jgi:hypothetical protein
VRRKRQIKICTLVQSSLRIGQELGADRLRLRALRVELISGNLALRAGFWVTGGKRSLFVVGSFTGPSSEDKRFFVLFFVFP